MQTRLRMSDDGKLKCEAVALMVVVLLMAIKIHEMG
jgi:hypothetical protein